MNPRILLLPGWPNAGPDHWQSRWEKLRGDWPEGRALLDALRPASSFAS